MIKRQVYFGNLLIVVFSSFNYQLVWLWMCVRLTVSNQHECVLSLMPKISVLNLINNKKNLVNNLVDKQKF